jgi:hypothetical protein
MEEQLYVEIAGAMDLRSVRSGHRGTKSGIGGMDRRQQNAQGIGLQDRPPVILRTA